MHHRLRLSIKNFLHSTCTMAHFLNILWRPICLRNKTSNLTCAHIRAYPLQSYDKILEPKKIAVII